VLGLAFLVLAIQRLGVATLVRAVAVLGPGGLALLALASLWTALGTLGWRAAFPPGAPPVSGFALFRAKALADSLNVLLPLLSVGGEPGRAIWLGQRIGLSAAAGTVVNSKLAFWVAGYLFLLLSLPAIALREALRFELWLALALALLIGCAIAAGAYLAVVARKVRLLPVLLRRWGVPLRGDAEARWEAIDAYLYDFYARRRAAGCRVLAIHLLERLARAAEFWLLAHLLGLPLGPLEAMAVAALSLAVTTAAFFIPAGQIGASEGGQMLALMRVGASAEDGLTLALARRLRSLSWAALWLGLEALLTRRR
jgi:uncharacterized membrane protein YbhN (UPF0104 family)